MSQFYLDNQAIKFKSGETILQAAQNAGIQIPVLCHKKETASCGNCMVCAVKELESKKFIASCSTLAVNEQRYENNTEEIAIFRKSAVELLLAEHIGDCVAPCKLVCPQKLNIPQLMKKLSNKENITDFRFNPEICDECGGRCEKACRRGFFDRAISIRELLKDFGEADKSITRKEKNSRPEYFHFLGKCDQKSLKKIYGIKIAHEKLDADRCLQCSCNAESDCELRNMASLMKARQARFKLSDPLFLEPVVTPTIVYYPGKCIRCNRCIRLGEQLKSIKHTDGPVMTGRGLNSRVDSPVGLTFDQAFAPDEDKFIAICPTGALARP